RLYKRQEKVIFEGSYEITPFSQRDIDSLRLISPRFVFMLMLTLGALNFLWILNESSPAPELWQFVLGALIGPQLSVHIRHVRNLILLRSINTELIRGPIECSRALAPQASSWECFAFSVFFLILFVVARSWFIFGGAAACFLLGVQHSRLASSLHENLAKT